MSEREHPRVPYVVRVEYRTPSSFLVAYSVNLSRGGIFLETNELPPIGSDVALQIAVPEANPIPLTGRVTWRREERDADGPPGIGVEFEAVSETLGMIIDGLVGEFAGLNVLLVCHNTGDRNALSRQIRSIVSTAEVVGAGDSQLGDNLLDKSIDLVIVDADFDPEGAEVMVRHAAEVEPPIPSIALASNPELRDRFREAGATEVALNPPPFADFQRLIVRALGRPSSVK
jgi:uncharacterized protein (TIGR02266 family)